VLDPAEVRAVLLDMDGTLVDSDAAVERGWRVWAARYGLPEADVLAIAHGSPAHITMRRLLPDLPAERVAADEQEMLTAQYTDLDGVAALPGVASLLAVLERRALPWAVVTSADLPLATVRLRTSGIPVPPVLITVEQVEHGKPAPDGYLAAAARLGVPPASCLVVEDAAPGVAAGHAAGMPVAALKGVPADLPIASLTALARWLDP
jgi:HAD superfamily hydrolase (TIGR01509 family)